MPSLPSDLMKAELRRLGLEHGRSVMDALTLETEQRNDRWCLVAFFADGMEWVVPFDPEAQEALQAAWNRSLHDVIVRHHQTMARGEQDPPPA